MKKVIENEEGTNEEKVLLNTFQACNYFKLTEQSRRIAEKIYKDLSLSTDEWEKLLNADKLII